MSQVKDDDEFPPYAPDMTVRCPKDDEAGCGSANVLWDAEDGVYDCMDCGQWFGPEAADPPHRRKGEQA